MVVSYLFVPGVIWGSRLAPSLENKALSLKLFNASSLSPTAQAYHETFYVFAQQNHASSRLYFIVSKAEYERRTLPFYALPKTASYQSVSMKALETEAASLALRAQRRWSFSYVAGPRLPTTEQELLLSEIHKRASYLPIPFLRALLGWVLRPHPVLSSFSPVLDLFDSYIWMQALRLVTTLYMAIDAIYILWDVLSALETVRLNHWCSYLYNCLVVEASSPITGVPMIDPCLLFDEYISSDSIVRSRQLVS